MALFAGNPGRRGTESSGAGTRSQRLGLAAACCETPSIRKRASVRCDGKAQLSLVRKHAQLFLSRSVAVRWDLRKRTARALGYFGGCHGPLVSASRFKALRFVSRLGSRLARLCCSELFLSRFPALSSAFSLSRLLMVQRLPQSLPRFPLSRRHRPMKTHLTLLCPPSAPPFPSAVGGFETSCPPWGRTLNRISAPRRCARTSTSSSTRGPMSRCTSTSASRASSTVSAMPGVLEEPRQVWREQAHPSQTDPLVHQVPAAVHQLLRSAPDCRRSAVLHRFRHRILRWPGRRHDQPLPRYRPYLRRHHHGDLLLRPGGLLRRHHGGVSRT